MNAGLYGLLAALGWGTADFIARFTGRGVGTKQALLGMLCVSALMISLLVLVLKIPLVYTVSGWHWLLLTGAGTLVATLLLYWGLARGPVTIVAPIVGSFPIFNVILAVLLGTQLNAMQWFAILVVFIGIWLVALAAKKFESTPHYNRQYLHRTIIIATASALGFGVTIAAAQTAVLIYGELQTVFAARWISLSLLVLAFLCKREAPVIALSYWPLIALQGLLDTVAYAALAWSANYDHAEIAVVVSSGFSIVTVLLARVFLKEAMTWGQWGGVVAIIVGIASLSMSG